MTTRGWCPTVFEPMQSGDGWLLRIKPRRARLSAADASAIALAARNGSGTLNLTNRGNLQLRGFPARAIPAAVNALLQAGLADADPALERRRNLLVPPLLGLDPALSPALPGVIAGLETMLAGPAFADLPGKFGIVIDGGGALPLAGEDADLRVCVSGARAFVGVGGSAQAIACAAAEAADVAGRLCRAFLRVRGNASRMRAVAAGRIFAAAELAPSATLPPPAATSGNWRTVGFAWGRLHADTLAKLARLGGDLRVTPWRSLVLPEAARDGDIAALGGIIDPHDPRRAIVTCAGRPSCPSAFVPTESDAAALLAAHQPRSLVHVSGCPKGCAHPGPAPLTLAGEPGGTYSLVRDGRAGDRPLATGLTVAEAVRRLEYETA